MHTFDPNARRIFALFRTAEKTRQFRCRFDHDKTVDQTVQPLYSLRT